MYFHGFWERPHYQFLRSESFLKTFFVQFDSIKTKKTAITEEYKLSKKVSLEKILSVGQ